MTDQQFNKLMNAINTHNVILYGIMNLLQAHNVKVGANAAGIQFKDTQKIIDSTAESIKVPG